MCVCVCLCVYVCARVCVCMCGSLYNEGSARVRACLSGWMFRCSLVFGVWPWWGLGKKPSLIVLVVLLERVQDFSFLLCCCVVVLLLLLLLLLLLWLELVCCDPVKRNMKAFTVASVLVLCAVALAKDPDEGLAMADLVTRHGYPIEEHFVTTADGYILGMFRIPHGRNATSHNASKPPVLLQHALLDSSFAYVCNLPNESLGYILADAGYDVWFGNNRGNKYSTNHTHLSPKKREFWEFTYDDMALVDLPAEVDYITSVTGAAQISYVGHSEGTIQAFAGFSWNQTLASKIRVFIALAPVAYVYHIKTAFLQLMCKLDLDEIFVLFGDKSFLPSSSIISKIAPGICNTLPMGCADVLELIVGPARNINNVRFECCSISNLNTRCCAQTLSYSFSLFVYQSCRLVYLCMWVKLRAARLFRTWCIGAKGCVKISFACTTTELV